MSNGFNPIGSEILHHPHVLVIGRSHDREVTTIRRGQSQHHVRRVIRDKGCAFPSRPTRKSAYPPEIEALTNNALPSAAQGNS